MMKYVDVIAPDHLRLLMLLYNYIGDQIRHNISSLALLLIMKLVLKYKDAVKLYPEELQFEHLLSYIERELHLIKQTISMEYTDEEEDQIVIACDQDLTIMETLVGAKSYIKIKVTGTEKETPEINPFPARVMIEEISLGVSKEAKVQEKIEVSEKQKGKKVMKEGKKLKEESSNKMKEQKNYQEQVKQKKLKKIEKAKEGKADKKKEKTENNYEHFNQVMTEAIATLVDERIRTLIPFIRDQILSKNVQEPKIQSKLIHQNYSCFMCFCNPIVGIRYECPKCQKFSLCQRCQPMYEHHHNLMKIKYLDDVSQKNIQNIIKELYEMFFANQKPKKEKKQQVQPNSERNNRFCRDLKLILGGKLVDYKKIVQENVAVPFITLLQKYCEQRHITQEEGNKKYIDMLADRLANKFKKQDPISIKIFIEENVSLESVQIEKLFAKKMKEKLAQEKENKKKEKQMEKQKKEEKKKDQTKVAVKEEKKEESLAKKQVEPKKCPGAHLDRDKKEIYNTMVEFYGEDRANEYPEFIEKNYSQGFDSIVQLWSNRLSMYESQ